MLCIRNGGASQGRAVYKGASFVNLNYIGRGLHRETLIKIDYFVTALVAPFLYYSPAPLPEHMQLLLAHY